MELTDSQIASIAAMLVGAIGYLWRAIVQNQKEIHRSLIDQNAKTERELAKCNEGHVETNRQLLEFSREMGELKGRQNGIENLSNRVLTEVHAAIIEGSSRSSKTDQSGADTGNARELHSGGLDLGQPNEA